MYVTGPNQVYAIDALTGAEIWKYARPQTPGMVGDASLGTNRGVAIRDDRVFFVTDNAHLIALDRATGNLALGNGHGPDVRRCAALRRHAGAAGGERHGDRGGVRRRRGNSRVRGLLPGGHRRTRVASLDRAAARRTGIGNLERAAIRVMGGGSTWLTGSYDPETDTLYWPTGNPFPDSEDAERGGDNLYTDSILALSASTGALKWHYQFTPHDLSDRDATEPPVLVDAEYLSKPRKLLLHADRNGFFYVLDRVTGELLLAKPFLRRVDWASGVPLGPGPMDVHK